MTPEKPYEEFQAGGYIRVMPKPEEGLVGVNVFGAYAVLTASDARALANGLLDAAAVVGGYPYTTGGYL